MKYLLALFLIVVYFSNLVQFGKRNQNNEWDSSWIGVPAAGEKRIDLQ